jgi:hypothetical protein
MAGALSHSATHLPCVHDCGYAEPILRNCGANLVRLAGLPKGRVALSMAK